MAHQPPERAGAADDQPALALGSRKTREQRLAAWAAAPGASFALVALAAVAAVVVVSVAHGHGPATATAAATRQGPPNIVVLMTDDETVEDMAVMPRTRALLGKRGVTFAHNYVSYPVCCPSRATFFSGQYAHNHHVMGLYPPTGGYIRFDRWNSLPVWLQHAGYTTAHIGKYMNGYGTQVKADVPPGWTEWHGAIDGSTYRMWGYTLDDNGHRHTYGSPFVEDPRLYQTDVYRRKAVDFIKRRAHSKRPFFLSVAFLAPHHEMKSVRDVTGKLVRPAPRYRDALRDESLDNGARPDGLIKLSTTNLPVTQYLMDFGNYVGDNNATHNLTLYRHPGGALVFGAGTIQWSWGLDSNHDRGSAAADVRMRQATVNLFADMGVQPGTLQSGLVSASASADTVAPSSTIASRRTTATTCSRACAARAA